MRERLTPHRTANAATLPMRPRNWYRCLLDLDSRNSVAAPRTATDSRNLVALHAPIPRECVISVSSAHSTNTINVSLIYCNVVGMDSWAMQRQELTLCLTPPPPCSTDRVRVSFSLTTSAVRRHGVLGQTAPPQQNHWKHHFWWTRLSSRSSRHITLHRASN